MKQAIKDLFASKKFILTLVAIIVWVVGKAGLHLEPAVVEGVVGLLALLITGISLADLGKEKGKALAGAAPVSEQPDPR